MIRGSIQWHSYRKDTFLAMAVAKNSVIKDTFLAMAVACQSVSTCVVPMIFPAPLTFSRHTIRLLTNPASKVHRKYWRMGQPISKNIFHFVSYYL